MGSIAKIAAHAAAIIVGGVVILSSVPAEARTFVGVHLFVPLYAGPSYYRPYGYGPYGYGPYGYGPYYGPTYYAPPVVAPQPQCRNGAWRQDDGSVVRGIACLYSDGNWRLAN